jgi:hypothetical protein
MNQGPFDTKIALVDRGMNSRVMQAILAAAYLMVWVVLGIWGLPAFTRIFVTLDEGEPLPWLTMAMLRQGAVGCGIAGTLGAGLIIAVGALSHSVTLRRILLLVLCLLLAGAIGVLLWPLWVL